MKYLMSELLLAEDAEKFMREHEGEFVNEYPIEGFVREAGMDVLKKASKFRISITPGILFDCIAKSIIDGIDVIVCYQDDEKGYMRFGKKIIPLENNPEE